jgi:uncharacterized protein YbjT (DUF2867 family)
MRVVVIGGTGLVGHKLVRCLAASGHDALPASPTTGVNTVTRIGLQPALAEAQVVVDVGDAPSFDGDAALEYFVTSGHNLADAERAAGVAHHILLSVVGADRLTNNGYMRAKIAQEALARSAGVPCTILRSTQSFELMRTVVDAATDGDVVRLSPALAQPIAASDIAAALAELVDRSPTTATCEVAGPQPVRLVDLAAAVLSAQHDSRHVESDADAVYYGSRLDDHILMPGAAARLGSTRFEDWLREDGRARDWTPRGADRHR